MIESCVWLVRGGVPPAGTTALPRVRRRLMSAQQQLQSSSPGTTPLSTQLSNQEISHLFSQCDVRRIGLWGVVRSGSAALVGLRLLWPHFSLIIPYGEYEHNARSGGTPAAPREKDLVWRLVVPGD